MTESEMAILRKEIAFMVGKMDKVEKKCTELEKENVKLRRLVAFYESANMPTSQPSLYNAKRQTFRKNRGEDPAGSPGDKAKMQDGTTGQGQENGAQSKKRGPPIGHDGISHHRTAEMTVRYQLKSEQCSCGGTLVLQRPVSKLVTDFDKSWKVRTMCVVLYRGVCDRCGMRVTADSPFPDGTSLGPKMLCTIFNMFHMAIPDEKITGFFHAMFDLELAENTISAARRAMAEKFGDLIQKIAVAIQLLPWVMIDEGRIKRGDGHWGYVWVVNTPVGVFVVFANTRAAAILYTDLHWLEGANAVCDGYPGYPDFFSEIQRCWRHVLAKVEELAVNDDTYEPAYDALLAFYKEIKTIKHVAPFTIMELSQRVYAISQKLGNTKAATYLRNAIPNLFTFLRYEGMPPHNNDTEREIRDGVIPQRNARHKIVTAEGRQTFSRLVTVARTAHKQGISPGRALIELIQNPSWDITKSKDVPFSYVNADGTSYSIFDVPGPPEFADAVRQVQAAGVHSITP